MDKQFIRVLPFYSQPIVGEPEMEPLMPVALWRCAENVCEGQGRDSPCDDSEGLYYTIASDEVTFWCPRHWYEAHVDSAPGQRLLPMTAKEYEQERREHKESLLKQWAVVAERIETSAHILSSAGLQEASAKLWQTYGWIRSSIRRM